MRYLSENEGARVVVVAPTYPQMKSGTMDTFYDLFPQEWVLRKLSSADSLYCDVLLPGQNVPGRIYFRNAYNPDSFRSLEVALVWIDEAAYCNSSAIKVLTACQRQKRP